MPVDQGEFEVLCRTHYERLIRLCYLWLDDPHEAEDMVQEVSLNSCRSHRACIVPWPGNPGLPV